MSAGELSFGAPQSGVLSFGIVSRRPLVLLDDGRMSEMPFGETLQPATMPPDTTSWANLPGMPAVIAAGADAAAARAAIGAAAASGGDVVGPASATDGMVAAFDGATGKLLKAVTLTNTDVGAAPVNTALTDAAASSTLPATSSTALTTLLQQTRDYLKYLRDRTGAAPEVKTSAFTAVNGGDYACDTSTAAFTVTAPASPSAGDAFVVRDYGRSFKSKNLTVARNGQKFLGETEDYMVDQKDVTRRFVFVNSTIGWMVQ